MEACSTVPCRASNFIVTAYTVVGDRLLPEMPSCCLAGEASKRCWLRIDRKRVRKTGPKFALCVVECKTHGHCFTLYPPGYVPYGRILIAPVASDQQLLRVERPARSGTELAWNRTIFRAAIDAAHGIAWPRQLGPGDAERGIETWRTLEHREAAACDPIDLRLASDPDGAQTHLEILGGLHPDHDQSQDPVGTSSPPLEELVLRALRQQSAPLSRADLRTSLRVGNNRLGAVLDDLETQGRISRSDLGIALAGPSPSASSNTGR